ncbi:hypothetical protein [Nocardia sp. NPDC020380]|uniref:hypothetical protein n=1 Tax=Nocardia sp. NPDC020380 TaxID=3364309 RepID=UPI003788D9CA
MAEEWWKPPVDWADVIVAGVIYLVAVAAAWVVAGVVPEYRGLVQGSSGDPRYLGFAYVVAWVGIGVTLLLVPMWVMRAVYWRQRAWRTALLAFPMLAEAWVVGLLVAIVMVSV